MKKQFSITKKLKSKWSMDEYGNISGNGQFFHVSELKFVHFREEKDNTFTIALLIGVLTIGLHFGRDRKSSQAQLEWFKNCIKSYQKVCKNSSQYRDNNMKELVIWTKKAIKECK